MISDKSCNKILAANKEAKLPFYKLHPDVQAYARSLGKDPFRTVFNSGFTCKADSDYFCETLVYFLNGKATCSEPTEKVIFRDPATIVLRDDCKAVTKTSPEDSFSKLKGFLLCQYYLDSGDTRSQDQKFIKRLHEAADPVLEVMVHHYAKKMGVYRHEAIALAEEAIANAEVQTNDHPKEDNRVPVELVVRALMQNFKLTDELPKRSKDILCHFRNHLQVFSIECCWVHSSSASIREDSMYRIYPDLDEEILADLISSYEEKE